MNDEAVVVYYKTEFTIIASREGLKEGKTLSGFLCQLRNSIRYIPE
jgi:hypothetical protein